MDLKNKMDLNHNESTAEMSHLRYSEHQYRHHQLVSIISEYVIDIYNVALDKISVIEIHNLELDSRTVGVILTHNNSLVGMCDIEIREFSQHLADDLKNYNLISHCNYEEVFMSHLMTVVSEKSDITDELLFLITRRMLGYMKDFYCSAVQCSSLPPFMRGMYEHVACWQMARVAESATRSQENRTVHLSRSGYQTGQQGMAGAIPGVLPSVENGTCDNVGHGETGAATSIEVVSVLSNEGEASLKQMPSEQNGECAPGREVLHELKEIGRRNKSHIYIFKLQ